MALQNNLFAQMLILAVCLASASASTSTSGTRDPKELRIFRLSNSPSYRVPSTHFRNGVIQRQINSPIDPMIGQQGLGPFFGYFPNFLTQPCPATNECKNCTVCPVVPKPPPPGNLTTCISTSADLGAVSAAENGTIKMGGNGCKIILVSFYPNTRIKFNCTGAFQGNVGPTITSTNEAMKPSTDYVSKENYLSIVFGTGGPEIECTWKSVPA